MTNGPSGKGFGWIKGLALFVAGALVSAVYFGFQLFSLSTVTIVAESMNTAGFYQKQVTPLRSQADIDKEMANLAFMQGALPDYYCWGRLDMISRITAARTADTAHLDYDPLLALVAKLDRPGPSTTKRWNGLWFVIAAKKVEPCDVVTQNVTVIALPVTPPSR